MGLFGSNILEFTLSVVFVYLLCAALASAIGEWISALLRVRSSMLREGVSELFVLPEGVADALKLGRPAVAKEFAEKIFAHPLVQAPRDPKLLTYIPSRTFALALFDVLSPTRERPATLTELRSALVAEAPAVQRVLRPLLDTADGSVDRAREAVAQWFDESMTYVTTQYKRKLQWWLFVIGLILSVAINIDSLRIYDELWKNAPLRAAIAKSAEATAGTETPSVRALVDEADKLGLPIGWDRANYDRAGKPTRPEPKNLGERVTTWLEDTDPKKFFAAIIGWLITAVAAAMGAPFWFDLLNKIVNLRIGGKKPEPAATPRTSRADTGPNAPVDEGAIDRVSPAVTAARSSGTVNRSPEPGSNEVEGETG